TILSFSPLHAPFFLMIRLPHDPPVLTTAAAFVWMLACTIGLIRLMVAGFTRNIVPTETGLLLYARLYRTIGQVRQRAGETRVTGGASPTDRRRGLAVLGAA